MERLDSALNEEGAELATADVYTLCELAHDFHLGIPTRAALRRNNGRTLRKLDEVVTKQSQRLSRTMAQLDTAFNECSDQTLFEIGEKLQAKGITPDEFERVMNGFADVLQAMPGEPAPPTKSGNTRGMDSD
jgi:hypothetical protein